MDLRKVSWVRKLLILGAGQYGMVAQEIAKAMGIFQKISFLDDNSTKAIGRATDYEEYTDKYSEAIVAIGNAEKRMELLEKLESSGYIVPVLIHPQAYVSPSAVIGKGSFIEPLAVIHTDVKIGAGCIISAGTIVNHNAIVNDGCHLNCGTIVGARSEIIYGTRSVCGQIIE